MTEAPSDSDPALARHVGGDAAASSSGDEATTPHAPRSAAADESSDAASSDEHPSPDDHHASAPGSTYSDDEDAALMMRVRDEDGVAFEALFERHFDAVVRVLHLRVRDRAAAEDLAQDAFVRVWNARHRYEPTAKFTTWLYRIATNLARNWHRDRGVRRTSPTSFGPPDDLGGPAGGEGLPEPADTRGEEAGHEMHQAELRSLVIEAVERLPESQREALLLRRYEDLSYQEIGERLDLSVDAVKSLLSRARANLRDLLDPYWSRLQREWEA